MKGMLFSELALIAMLAAVLGIVMDKLRQPTILGYLLAGLIVAGSGMMVDHSMVEVLELLGQVGVVLLLFLVGMEMSAPKIKAVGKTALAVGVGQIVFTTMVGWVIATLGGFDRTTSLYLAVALAFSSTIVVVKLLGEKNDLQSLHGKIAVGFLLVQDIAAILILVAMSAIGKGELTLALSIQILLKSLGIILVMWWLSLRVVPKLVASIAPSPELLFLSSIAWGLGLAAIMVWSPIGFTIEAGGFLAGVTLANSGQHHEILARIRPLRDFFIMLFFVLLAVNLSAGEWDFSLGTVLVLSTYVLIGNPLIVLLIMRQLGYKARTSFLVSLTVAQISEFSMILIALGESLGQVPGGILGLVTLVAVITMTASTYLIWSGPVLWRWVKPWAKWLERPHSQDTKLLTEHAWKDHVVLIGCDRTGQAILAKLRKMKVDVVVMDFNPDVVKQMEEINVPVIYGDIEDIDVYDSLGLHHAHMVISTVANYEATLMLLEYIRNKVNGQKLMVIVTALYAHEARVFYDGGADYVVIPKLVNGVHLGHIVSKIYDRGKEALQERAEKEIKELLA